MGQHVSDDITLLVDVLTLMLYLAGPTIRTKPKARAKASHRTKGNTRDSGTRLVNLVCLVPDGFIKCL